MKQLRILIADNHGLVRPTSYSAAVQTDVLGPTPGKSCQFNRSAQHLRGVYSQESRSPKFFSGVDLDVARSCPVGIAWTRKGRSSSASTAAASGWC
jgi:hypothetical protein